MKRILFAAFLVLTIGGHAQDKYTPDIHEGTKLNFTVLNDENTPLVISVDSLAADRIKLGWNIEGYGTGGWIMKQKSLDSATRGWWNDPVVGTDDEISDEQTVLIFSKVLWDELQKNKKADYDMQTYTIKEPTEEQQLQVNGKIIDFLLLEGQNGSSRIWLLNNSKFPAIIKIEGNTMGPNLVLNTIE